MNILLVQTSFLGDTILSTPVISGLNKLFPEAQIWMMTTPLSSSLVKRDPLLAGVISYDKRGKNSGLPGLIRMSRKIRKMKFAKVYSLHRSFRTSLLVRHTPLFSADVLLYFDLFLLWPEQTIAFQCPMIRQAIHWKGLTGCE